MTYTYQWKRCDADGLSCVDVVGATGPNYVLSAPDVGSRMRVFVSDGVTDDTSAPTAVIGATTIPWGARIDGAFYGGLGDAPWDATAWNLFESHAQRKVTAVHWGGSGTQLPTSYDTTAGQLTRNRGAFTCYTAAASTQQMLDLAAGTDVRGALTAVTNWAAQVNAQGYPILSRFAWEMNGNWGYPWQTAAGITQATYRAAFRKWSDLVRAASDCISICWCPNVAVGVPDPTPWDPGAAYYDWPGCDGYNQSTSVYTSPSGVFDTTLAILQGLAPGKPIVIWETGCAAPTGAPGKAAWVTNFLGTWLPSHSEVKLWLQFNEAGNPALPHIEVGDAATTQGGAVQAAFATGIGSGYYRQNEVNSITYPSHALLPIPA